MDSLFANAFPMFLVMAVLALAMPIARPVRPWAGVGIACVAGLGGTLVATLASWDPSAIDCAWNLLGSKARGASGQALCPGSDPVPLALAALPAILGIVVLLAWIWRHTTPAAQALRTATTLVACAAAVVLVGQVNANLGLLTLVVLIGGGYVWLWIRDRRGEMRTARTA